MPTTCLMSHTSRFDLPDIWLKDLGKATRLRDESFGFRIPLGARNLSPLRNVPMDTGAHDASYSVGTVVRCSFPGLRRSGSELDQSRPSSAQDKNK